MKQLTVSLKKKTDDSYKIILDKDYFDLLVSDLKSKKWGNKYAIITDSKVKKLYGNKLQKDLKRSGINCHLISFPFGEKNKSLIQADKIASSMSALGFHRDDCIIALGGGVTGDLAGFIASIYMRGIPYIQIPTTLLSMVDSSVGGKTAVDTKWGKNLIGSFYQPKKVYINPLFLETLPKKQLLNGIGEVIKYGVISNPAILKLLSKKINKVLAINYRTIEKLIISCIKIKADIVKKDEKENGLRKHLNYGHTIGHAIEKLSKFKVQHGEAICIGMAIINSLAVNKKYFTQKQSDAIEDLFKLYKLPTKLPKNIDIFKLMELIQIDKKNIGGKTQFIIPTKLGKVQISDKVTKRDIIKACKKHI